MGLITLRDIDFVDQNLMESPVQEVRIYLDYIMSTFIRIAQ